MRKWTLFLLSLLMFFSISLRTASASPAGVTASLDMATGIVTIAGNSGLPGEHLITVQVRDPHNRLAYLDQGKSSTNGDYLFHFTVNNNVAGTYSVSVAGDADINVSQTSFTVNSLSSIQVTLNPDTIWPPNKKMITVTADVYVSDPFSQIDQIVLTSITCNDPIQPDDIQDAQFGTLDKTFALRAEKSKDRSQRVYTITYTATDKVGNRSVATATVTVPHDQSSKNKQ